MKIGLIQLTSVLDYKINIEKISTFLSQGIAQGAKDFFLPETFYSLTNGVEMTPYFLEKGNEHEKNVCELAKKFKANLWGGSCIYREGKQFFNRALCISAEGKIIGSYNKRHLFYFNNPVAGQVSYDEASRFAAGNSLCLIPMRDAWLLGTTVCYDVRFPEMYRKYSIAGANILTVASAFTVPTGKAHWHNLLKARAIENLSYVVASAQWGTHNERITTYGHSLVISPWGEVEVDMGEGEGIKCWDLDQNKVMQAREKLSNLWSNYI